MKEVETIITKLSVNKLHPTKEFGKQFIIAGLLFIYHKCIDNQTSYSLKKLM